MKFGPDNAANAGQRGGRSRSPDKAATARANAEGVRARELTEQHAFLRRPEWTPPDIVAAGRRLKRFAPDERARVGQLLDQDGIPPRKALDILRRLARRPPAERATIYTLAASEVAHERKIALTRAAALPPPVDPGLLRLREAERAIRLAAQFTRLDALRGTIMALLPVVAGVADRLRKEARRS